MTVSAPDAAPGALRFGLVGTGYWAEETHGAGLAAHPAAELVGVWGRNPEKAARVAGRFGARAFDDLGAMFAEVDAVAVALPPDVQAGIAARAATAGKHLLLDKPLALTLPQADAVVAAVERTQVSSVVFFTNRFKPEITEWLDEVAAESWDGGDGVLLGSIYRPGSPYADSPWRATQGALWDVGPHALSVAVPVLGAVARVGALRGKADTVHLALRHEGGASSTLALSLTVPPDATRFRFGVYGEAGHREMPTDTTSPLEAFGHAVDELVASVRERSPHACDVRFGRDVVAVLAAAQEVLDRPLESTTASVDWSGQPGSGQPGSGQLGSGQLGSGQLGSE